MLDFPAGLSKGGGRGVTIGKKVAIIDYGVGNLFSIKQACAASGMTGVITDSPSDIDVADAVILPGVGAFGSAMSSLTSSNLVPAIKKAAGSGKPLLGICLGMQLLMERSHEFGLSKGLGIVKGEVVKFNTPKDRNGRVLKVPHVGWNTMKRESGRDWDKTLLGALPDETYMYFVHSYYCVPDNPGVVLSTTGYGRTWFCSSFQVDNIFGCQFHPEKSGLNGLKIYQRLSSTI